jgi:hypothetical protein
MAVAIKRTRRLLPQNLLTQADVALEGFETAGDWTAASGSVAANTTAGQFVSGTQSIKLTTNSGATATMTKTVSWAAIDYEFFSFWFYLHNSPTSITFSISSTTDFSKSFSYTIDPPDSGVMSWPSTSYLAFRVPLASMTNTGSESWANTMIRIRFTVVSASGVQSVSFDDLYGGYKRIPVVLFRHDGVYDQLIDNGAFAHYETLGMVGDAYISCKKTYQGDTHRATEAEIQSLYAAGWSVNTYLFGFTGAAYGMGDLTQAEQEYQMGNGQVYINEQLACGHGRHFTFTGGGTYLTNSLTEAALDAAECLTALGPYSALNRPDYFPPDMHNIAFKIMGSQSLDDAKAMIDTCIERGQYLIVNFDALDSTGQTTANHIAWLDYIYEKWQAHQIYPITIDEFYALAQGPAYVPTAGNKPRRLSYSASTWSQPRTLFSITHEAGNLNDYEVQNTDSGNLSVSASAGMGGSSYGIAVHYASNTTTKNVQKGLGLFGESVFRFRFYYDPNSITLASTTQQIVCTSSNATAFSGIHMVNIVHLYSSGNFRLRLGTFNDSNGYSNGSQIIITDAPHYVEVEVTRASSSVAADGQCRMWIDGSLESTVSSIDNYDLFVYSDVLQIGAVTGGSSSNSGTFYLDEIEANVDGTEIGA